MSALPVDGQRQRRAQTLRGIARRHGVPARRAAALTTAEIRKLSRACGTGPAGARDRALILVGFAGALRRSELVALDLEQVTWTRNGMKLLIERSKTDAEGQGAEIAIPRSVTGDLPGYRASAVAGSSWHRDRPSVSEGQPWRRSRCEQAGT